MASPERTLVAGRYRIEKTLGRGGSAIVERAIDTRLDRPVALKRMRTAEWDERSRRRFLDEARTLASLRHPSLLEVYDAGIDERGTPYVASRLLTGETLEHALSRGPVDPYTALGWCLPILGALAIAHDRGIVHRDVKPSNIYLEHLPDGRCCPVLLDFGIAHRIAHEGDTTPGTALGTPAYIAPEVIAGEPPSTAADLWAMGVVLYRLFSRRHPFDVSGPLATVAAIGRDTPAPLGEHAPGLPPAFALAVDRALRPRHLRYPDARSFARALLEAAITSDVELPSNPDPQGLPDWTEWLTAAASRETTDKLSTAPARTSTPAAPRRARRPLALLILIVGLAASALLWAQRSTPTIPSDARAEPHRAPNTERARARRPPLSAPAGPGASVAPEPSPSSNDPAPNGPSPSDPAPTDSTAPSSSPAPPRPSPTPQQRRPRASPTAASGDALPEIVTSWDL